MYGVHPCQHPVTMLTQFTPYAAEKAITLLQHSLQLAHTMLLLNRPAHSKATCSFSFASSSVCNFVPNDVRCAPSLSSFKSRLNVILVWFSLQTLKLLSSSLHMSMFWLWYWYLSTHEKFNFGAAFSLASYFNPLVCNACLLCPWFVLSYY